MSEHIKKLDNKYIVIKRDDLNLLSEFEKDIFNQLCGRIEAIREETGKTPNNYVVLNLDDTTSISYLLYELSSILHAEHRGNYKIDDIATTLVNSILVTR